MTMELRRHRQVSATGSVIYQNIIECLPRDRHYRKGVADTKEKWERVSVLVELRSQWERQMCVQKNKIILERDMCRGGHRQNNLWGSGLLFSLRRFPRQSSGKKILSKACCLRYKGKISPL